MITVKDTATTRYYALVLSRVFDLRLELTWTQTDTDYRDGDTGLFGEDLKEKRRIVIGKKEILM